MKHILFKIILPFAFIFCQAITQAQTLQQIPPFIQKSYDNSWYKTQQELWQKEVAKNKKNENAWSNYYYASRYVWLTNAGGFSKEGSEKLQYIVTEMNKAIPKTYAYYAINSGNMGIWNPERITYLEAAYRLRPDNPRLYIEFVTHYEVYESREKRKEMSVKLYNSNYFSTGLLNYSYNVLNSMEQNGILFTVGDNDTYPVWILQDALGIRTDVTVINTSLFRMKEYRSKILKEIGIPASALLDSLGEAAAYNPTKIREWETEGVKYVSENSKQRPVYIGLTSGENDYVKALKDKLYLVGLVSKYSETKIDNIAFLRKNIEENFLTDYLVVPLINDYSVDWVNICNQNYIPPFISLYKHYKTAGLTKEAERIKIFVEKIAYNNKKEKEILPLLTQ